jgi:hypothetical protein
MPTLQEITIVCPPGDEKLQCMKPVPLLNSKGIKVIFDADTKNDMCWKLLFHKQTVKRVVLNSMDEFLNSMGQRRSCRGGTIQELVLVNVYASDIADCDLFAAVIYEKNIQKLVLTVDNTMFQPHLSLQLVDLNTFRRSYNILKKIPTIEVHWHYTGAIGSSPNQRWQKTSDLLICVATHFYDHTKQMAPIRLVEYKQRITHHYYANVDSTRALLEQDFMNSLISNSVLPCVENIIFCDESLDDPRVLILIDVLNEATLKFVPELNKKFILSVGISESGAIAARFLKPAPGRIEIENSGGPYYAMSVGTKLLWGYFTMPESKK